MSASNAEVEQLAREMFKMADTDNSGFIDAKEVQALFIKINNENKKKTDPAKLKKEVECFMKQIDQNKDNKVSFAEFIEFVKKMFE